MDHPITPEESRRAREIWAQMDQDMREFVTALVDLGLVEGRRGLAQARIAIHPDRLDTSDGVTPNIPTREEREAIEAARGRNKGGRA
ncbi:MAG: hypothetical protein CGU28_16870 [Candidatus Dactylopiibacterium carminicum]|uniref:Uncharacterized protein n=1 Tax=Candidatus Dactylopiibacterium carminicum TaxID=857335 RepID=A0A272ENU3_9RHOO|nr:hypothetical protein [Candidatus Dactylopiibacterium carminicum]KAF7597749.1 hypothetical protein BGI27_17115 [Candidatus Dactylopiibacterium carminicum]PAS91340.1 MAG: hypothetical protein CGU29_16955 [Candidatus Dactylopiibacterium carminicum]PAS92232.1 MAG: hypothetical protein CGU28_16870 [Candidatus Dactylopiibacterium carminicum]PAS95020.1 MAG: hypothetical protein BSR46_17155 [Candidatus Dactylopiibacterium carminicum]